MGWPGLYDAEAEDAARAFATPGSSSSAPTGAGETERAQPPKGGEYTWLRRIEKRYNKQFDVFQRSCVLPKA